MPGHLLNSLCTLAVTLNYNALSWHVTRISEIYMCFRVYCTCVWVPASKIRDWENYLVCGLFYFRCGSITRAGMPSALS